jgi:L-threonylcarbamoyladenylate synthase
VMELLELNESNLEQCVERMCRGVLAGELMIFPTDTVYGLGGAAFSQTVLDKLLAIKPDRTAKPTAILIDNIIRMSRLAGDVPGPRIVALAETYWPGPLTMVWHVGQAIPEKYRGADKSLGYRIPNSEFLLRVMKETERPLWATSANMPGQPAPRLFAEIAPELIQKCDLVIKARALLTGKSSAVVDVRGREPVVVRENAIPAQDIHRIWKRG